MDALWARFNQDKVREFIEISAQEMVSSIKDNITSCGIKLKSNNLVNSVKYEMRSFDSATIFIDQEKVPYAKYLEEGYGPFDMKAGMLRSPKAKTSKKGNKYIRIPINGQIMTVSENSSSSWRHPGYQGKLFFKHGVEESLPNIVKTAQEVFFSRGE